MFDKSSGTLGVTEIAVEVTLSDQQTFSAKIFAKVGLRLQDVLNDDRAFIPIVRNDGASMMVAKTSLFSVIERSPEEETEKEETKPQGAKRFDPYAALRVEKSATLAEIKRAYKDRIKSVHPDSIAALDLDEDLAKAAVLVAQRVNRAYKLIMDERAGENEPTRGAA